MMPSQSLWIIRFYVERLVPDGSLRRDSRAELDRAFDTLGAQLDAIVANDGAVTDIGGGPTHLNSNRIVTRVRAYARANNLSKLALAQKAGLANSTLRSFDNEDWDCRLTTLRKLEALVPNEFPWPPAKAKGE